MTIILFGATGRLGTAIERLLTRHTFLTPTPQEVDITNRELVKSYVKEHPANLVINCAAFNDVDGAESKTEIATMINGTAAGYIAEAADEAGLPIVHFSSDYVFDGTKVEGYVETDTPNPVSVYGQSKLLGEKLVAEHNPRHYILRTSRLYGRPARDPNAKRSFVEIVLDLASKQSAFSINGAEVSAPTLVDDIALTMDQYIDNATLAPGIYHMSNAGGCTWYEWAVAIAEIKKLPVTITPRDPNEQPRPAKRPDFSVLISTKLPPMRPWREALEAFLQST